MENPYHNKIALYKGNLGYIQFWGWKNSYLFLNIEKGSKKILKPTVLKTGRTIKLLEKEEFSKLYRERNFPISSFNGKIHNGNTTDNLTERQKMYGVIHDAQIKCILDFGTNGIWTDEFCRTMALFITNVQLYRNVEKLFGGISKAMVGNNRVKYNNLVIRYHEANHAVYTKNCKILGLCNDDPSIKEDEIKRYVKEAFEMKPEYQKKIFGSIKNKMAEMQYYMELSK